MTLFNKRIAVISIIASMVLVLNYLNLINIDLKWHEMIILINIAALQGWVNIIKSVVNLVKLTAKK
jgi:predicted membrane-bound spermidine synthase